jgi:5,6-dimethylbenzimidazole synthase
MSRKVGDTNEVTFFEVAEKRVSVRSFKADPVPDDHLEKILESARQAPNAGNQQPWRFLVIRDKDKLMEFRETAWRSRKKWLLDNGYESDTDEGMKAHYDKLLGAPVQIVVLIDKAGNYRGYGEQDGALAAENIMLAARALGYGSVMITGSVSAETVRRFFKVPLRYSINCLIPIGVPEYWPVKKDRRRLSEFVFYESVPRRPRGE